MQSTSCGSECPFVKNGMCKSCKECPNFIETWWVPEEGSQPVKLEDCSPKRLILQQQLMQARFDLTTQALVQSRNEYNQLCSYLKNLIEMSKTVISKQEELPHEKTILACLITMAAFVTSCTQTMTMVHTQGQADDVVDETSAASPNVSPTVTVPLTPGSSIGITK